VQRPRSDSEDGAAVRRSHLSAARIDIIVLTRDPALLATLREAAGPEHEILEAESPEAAAERLIGSHCGIFIIDVAVAHDVVELASRLRAQFPEIVLLATGRREEQHVVASLVGDGRIYRFLHKPISPQRAELFLSAALRRYGEVSSRAAPARTAAASKTNVRKSLAIALAVLLVGTAGALAAWFAYSRREPMVADTATANQPSATLIELLTRADAAYAAGTLVPPATDNAFDLYRRALRLDPENQHATQGMQRIIEHFEQRMTEALAARNLAAARNALTTLQRIAPRHPRLDALQTELVAASRQAGAARSATRTAEPPSPAPAAEPAHANVALAKAFLDAYQLVEPAEASALAALRRARDSGEDFDAIRIVATDLGTRLLNATLEAVDAGELDRARSVYETASALDAEFELALPDLDHVATRLQAAHEHVERAALDALIERATRLRMSGNLLEPPGENAFEVLQEARARGASREQLEVEQQRLSFALLERTRTALAAGDIDGADILADRAEAVLPGLPQTRALREQIGAARAEREASAVLQAAALPRKREVAAVYPREALLNRTQGWVDLEFTIDENGVPTDIRVKASEPGRVFDNAAVQALRQWRFEPVLTNGTARPRRAVLRMQFRLDSRG
jgi:TonB family protein